MMAYHIFSARVAPQEDRFLDLYLGSAVTIDFYWESVGRKLGLPLISSLTERADSDDGFVLIADELVRFGNELKIFEKYWSDENVRDSLPDEFLEKVKIIMEGIDFAVANGLPVMVA
ncbi:MAG TPA: hypothetical protein VF800_27930 [Telluria sp.]|jgi:hypothetical protein